MLWLSLAARFLVQARRRTLSLGAALAGAAFIAVLLASFMAGLRQSFVTSAVALCAGHVNVGGFYKTNEDRVFPLLEDPRAVEALVRRAVPSLRGVTTRLRAQGELIGPQGTVAAWVQGVDIAREPGLARALVPVTGRRVSDVARLVDADAAVLFAGQAKRLGVEAGDTITLRTQMMNGSHGARDLRVVAIVEDAGILGGWSIFVQQDALRSLYGLGSNAAAVVQVYLDDIDGAEAAGAAVRVALVADGAALLDRDERPFFMKPKELIEEPWTGGRVDVTTWRDEISDVTWILDLLVAISAIVLFVLALVTTAGVANAAWIAVRERKTEIGAFRALGMSRAHVALLFVLEGALLGLVASAVGAAVAFGTATLVAAAPPHVPLEALRAVLMSDALVLVPRATDAVAVVVGLTVVSGLAALLPARLAASISPVVAMQAEGT